MADWTHKSNSPREKTISMGYTISYQHHRKGYAFEALTALIGELHKRYQDYEFICMVDPENLASIKLLEKLEYSYLAYDAKCNSKIFGRWYHKNKTSEIKG